MSDLSHDRIVPEKAPRFTQLREGPARALQHCLEALRRGDRAVVLTAGERSERQAMLTEIARLAGRDHGRIERIEGSSIGAGFATHLEALDFALAEPKTGPLHWRPAVVRTLLIVDEAEMCSPETMTTMAHLRDKATGARVQVLLAGSLYLLPLLCRPGSAAMWRGVRLSVALETEAARAERGDIELLQSEIARTEARLAAQKRILSIFADSLADRDAG